MASTRVRTLPSGEKRYDVIWRCGGCEKPATGKQHVKTFVRKKDADVFELDRTREEIAGEPIKPTAERTTFGEFAGLYLDGERVRVREDQGWFARYRPTVRQS